jgi:putative MATE family efflux protein
MAKTHKDTLTQGSINKVLTRLTIPMIFGIFGMVAFNLIDAYFVGLMGTNELAALSFTFPVVMVLGAIGMGMSMGASAVISRAIGEGDQKKVQRLTVDSIVLAVVFAGIFVVVGLFTIDPLFRALGATEEVLPMIKDYMYIWYIGVIFVIVPFVGNSAIRSNGDTRTPAIIMMGMVGLNIILDPIMIFGVGPFEGMGIAGAAIATVISRSISLVAALIVLNRANMLTLEIPSFHEAIESWRSILYVGLPAAATNLVVPLSTAVITKLVAQYGEAAVGALGVSSKIDLFAIMVVVALSSVIGPFVGQNLGAKNYQRLITGINRSMIFALLWGIGMLVVMISTARYFAPYIHEDPAVVEVIILYLSITPFGYAARCVYALGNTILNVLNKPLHASGITLVQMFGVYIPLAYWGSELFGVAGIFGAYATAYLAGGMASYLLVRRNLKQNFPPGT